MNIDGHPLAKFGVETKELNDGLEIYGKPIPELKESCSIHCYDDHRVAMAFSVLGCIIKDSIIEEKRCVEKTWPNWWDDLENKAQYHAECNICVLTLIYISFRLACMLKAWSSRTLRLPVLKVVSPQVNRHHLSSSSACAGPARPSSASSPRQR